jgi:hypothetical protein
MKNYFILTFLVINGITGFCQSTIKVVSESTINQYPNLGILNAQILKNKIYVTCYSKDPKSNSSFPILLTVNNNKIENEVLIKPTNEVFLSELMNINNNILLVGGTFGEGIETQDFIGYYDLNNKLIWKLALEKKNEGFLKAYYFQDFFEIWTQGLNGFFNYRINYQGKILEKTSIPIHDIVMNILYTSKEEYVVLSDSLDRNGESISFKLRKIDKYNKIVESNEFKSIDSFLPSKIIEIEDGYVISGNISKDKFIPYIYFVNKDLTIRKSFQFHFEPDNYMFKSSFELRNILFDPNTNLIIGSGIAQIVNDNKNIVFTLDEDKMIDYQLLDMSGLWGNNAIMKSQDSDFLLFETIKINDDEDTHIRIINFKIK